MIFMKDVEKKISFSADKSIKDKKKSIRLTQSFLEERGEKVLLIVIAGPWCENLTQNGPSRYHQYLSLKFLKARPKEAVPKNSKNWNSMMLRSEIALNTQASLMEPVKWKCWITRFHLAFWGVEKLLSLQLLGLLSAQLTFQSFIRIIIDED